MIDHVIIEHLLSSSHVLQQCQHYSKLNSSLPKHRFELFPSAPDVFTSGRWASWRVILDFSKVLSCTLWLASCRGLEEANMEKRKEFLERTVRDPRNELFVDGLLVSLESCDSLFLVVKCTSANQLLLCNRMALKRSWMTATIHKYDETRMSRTFYNDVSAHWALCLFVFSTNGT